MSGTSWYSLESAVSRKVGQKNGAPNGTISELSLLLRPRPSQIVQVIEDSALSDLKLCPAGRIIN